MSSLSISNNLFYKLVAQPVGETMTSVIHHSSRSPMNPPVFRHLLLDRGQRLSEKADPVANSPCL